MAARALADTGRVRARLGDRTAAASALADAADELRELGAFHYEAQALEDLAELLEDPAEARACLERALAVYEAAWQPPGGRGPARLAG